MISKFQGSNAARWWGSCLPGTSLKCLLNYFVFFFGRCHSAAFHLPSDLHFHTVRLEANANGFSGLHMAAANLQTDVAQAAVAISYLVTQSKFQHISTQGFLYAKDSYKQSASKLFKGFGPWTKTAQPNWSCWNRVGVVVAKQRWNWQVREMMPHEPHGPGFQCIRYWRNYTWWHCSEDQFLTWSYLRAVNDHCNFTDSSFFQNLCGCYSFRFQRQFCIVFVPLLTCFLLLLAPLLASWVFLDLLTSWIVIHAFLLSGLIRWLFFSAFGFSVRSSRFTSPLTI